MKCVHSTIYHAESGVEHENTCNLKSSWGCVVFMITLCTQNKRTCEIIYFFNMVLLSLKQKSHTFYEEFWF